MQDRYSRQQLFKPIGTEGQQKLATKHVLIIGMGALGSAAAEALTRAGVGNLTLVDRDFVEWSNLQRQQLYTEQDALQKLPKVIAAKARLQAINHTVNITTHIMDACSEKLIPLLTNVDIMVDATDNFDIRFILNDVAQKYSIPWVYGSCVGSYGAYYTILPGTTPCLRCLTTVVTTGMTCDTVGIISPAVQIVAAYQVAEVLKFLVGDVTQVQKKYVMFDVWQNQHHAIATEAMQNPHCESCGVAPTYPALHYKNQTKLEVLCGRDAVQIRPAKAVHYDLPKLAQQLQAYGEIHYNHYLLACQAQDYRIVIFEDGRVVIHGVATIEQAKIIYYRLLG